MSKEILVDITDRQADYNTIKEQTWRTELGLRAISNMYDDHSNDRNSHENILHLSDNIKYRLFSAAHQYLVFLRETNLAENYLQKTYQKNPSTEFLFGNPYFEKVEQELSSIFDNIVFQISSLFDYLSHIICYINYTNKSNTVYWTKLAKTSRGQNNELSNTEIKKIIDRCDRRFVGRLYDYRSRLLHHRRDKHIFNSTATLGEFKFHLKFKPSDLSLKSFSLIVNEIGNGKTPSLTYLSSWIIKRTFVEIEDILDGLAIEIKKNSYFGNNLFRPKRGDNALLFISIDPKTKRIQPASEVLWKQYKNIPDA